jgi:hypothetical protein
MALTDVRRAWRTVKQRDGHAYRDTSVPAWEMVITEAGRAFYRREWARYRELFRPQIMGILSRAISRAPQAIRGV